MKFRMPSLYKPDYFGNMREIIKGIHPHLTEAQVIHACNMVGNFIRAQRVDMYDINLSGKPFKCERESEMTFEVEVAGLKIFGWAATD